MSSFPIANHAMIICCFCANFFYFEHVRVIMSGNCAINFHRYHFNKILVVFRCFGEILKILFVSRSFRDIHRSSEGNLGYYGGILWYSWVNVWTGDGVATEFTKVVFKENKSLLSYPQKAHNLNI